MKRLILLLALTLNVLAQPQHRMRDDATKDWPKITETAASEDAALKAVTSYLDSLRDRFSGTVLVARAGTPILHRSYGAGIRNDTKLNLGSINKIFTHVALLQLRDAGKVDFAKPVSSYLPELKLDPRITVQHLIEHKSGMGVMFGPKFDAARDQLRTMQDYAKIIEGEPLLFEPGTEQRYSNAGYIVLGLLIEKLTGRSYYDVVRERIYKPAGMTSTEWYARDEKIANLATGFKGPERTPNTDVLPMRGSSAGGGYSTAEDMLRFANALPKLISAKAYDELVGAEPSVAWAGGYPGVSAILMLEHPYQIIALSNYDSPAAIEVARNVRRAFVAPRR